MRKPLIVFFSRAGENYVNGRIQTLKVGNTELVASLLSAMTGGDLFSLKMVNPYPEDYRACVTAARQDMIADARPALQALPESLDPYDTVYLGYPNYCGSVPMPVRTFLDAFDWTGKTILPFCTHEGSGLGKTVDELRQWYPQADIRPGLAIRGADVALCGAVLHSWVLTS